MLKDGLSIHAAAAEAGAALALLAAGRAYSFAELAAAVEQRLAAWRTVSEGEVLVLVGESRPETIVTIFAAIEARMPIFFVHPRWPAAERRRYLEYLGLPSSPEGAGEFRAAWPAGCPPLEDGDERILAVLPTSGSSGPPKGVALSRRAFLSAIAASRQGLGWKPHDRWLLALPLAHVGGLSILLRGLEGRAGTVLADTVAGWEPAAVARQIENDEITLVSLVPTQLRRLLGLEGFKLPHRVRALLIGGAAASPALIAAAAGRGWPCRLTYGATEAASQIATQETPGPEGCGRPVPGVTVEIGVGHHIRVRGANLFSFYLPGGQNGRDAEGFFESGDLGRLDAQGNLHVFGRADDVIITGGENVHPLTVEAALEALPAIAAAVVFPLPDEEWGQLICAAVVPQVGQALPDLETLRTALKSTLPAYALPRRLFRVENLPQNSVGKLDRRVLARLFAG